MKTKHDRHWGSSLKRYPWSNKGEETPLESLISSTMNEWYDAKHPSMSIDEINLLNSITPSSCHYCDSNSFIKYGKTKQGLNRYKCKDCHKTFGTLTNTIFDSHKIPISEWFEYLFHLFEFHSLKTSSRDNKNASTTGRYWLFKVFEILKNVQDDIVLTNNIYLDEMFFSVKTSNIVTKDGKKLRGISRNKICVAVAIDNNKFLILVENTSKPSDKSTWEVLGKHISPKSRLIHDEERSHGVLIRNLELFSEVHSTEETKRLSDKDNPLDPINNVHNLIRRFMRAHGGYNRDNLQDWMNLIWFILSKPDNRYEKLRVFIEKAINTQKRIKYREVFKKKG